MTQHAQIGRLSDFTRQTLVARRDRETVAKQAAVPLLMQPAESFLVTGPQRPTQRRGVGKGEAPGSRTLCGNEL